MEFSQLPEVQDYKYTPLKTDEIRLLKIHPGLDEDVVSCSLEHFPLSSDEVVLPEYSALSYA
jgi:MOSC domain-containing protein YiiM